MVRTRFTPRRRPQNLNFDERRTAAAKEIANRRTVAKNKGTFTAKQTSRCKAKRSRCQTYDSS